MEGQEEQRPCLGFWLGKKESKIKAFSKSVRTDVKWDGKKLGERNQEKLGVLDTQG